MSHADAMLKTLKFLMRSGYCDLSDGDEATLIALGHQPNNAWGQPYRVKLMETEMGKELVIRTSVLIAGAWCEIEIR